MKVILCLTFSLLQTVCSAQEIMPRIGVSVTTANLPGTIDSYHTSFIPGFVTGVEAWFPIWKRAGIAGDLLFTQKGWRSEVATTDYHFTASQRMYYGELICLPYYRWSAFYFMMGPGLQYGLTGRTSENLTRFQGQGTVSGQHDIRFDKRSTGSGDYYVDNRVTLSGMFGAGVTLWEHLLIDLRYQASGFGTFTADPDGPSNPNGTYHSLQLTTALRLRR
jgi:opacity protein-like surface antigen